MKSGIMTKTIQRYSQYKGKNHLRTSIHIKWQPQDEHIINVWRDHLVQPDLIQYINLEENEESEADDMFYEIAHREVKGER